MNSIAYLKRQLMALRLEVASEIVDDIESTVNRLEQEREYIIDVLKKTQKRLSNMECECDSYYGFTCGLHAWRREIDSALSKMEANK